ncbi:MAG: outer membrane lipoprotein-sorting protein [Spirochaetales bacterium]|nr:outer membrane lipoprotein-sorting protein [Spirochaetales bacterium]
MKKQSLIYLVILAFLLVSASPRNAELKKEYGVDFDLLLKEVDEIGNFETTDFSSDISIAAVDSEGKTNYTKARVYRRDREGKYVLIITEPDSKKGKGYLQIGDNLWIYDPSSRKFEHTNMKETIEGSDAKNSDFNMNSLSDNYHVEDVITSKLGEHECWVLELQAFTTDVSYPMMRIWVRKDLPIVLRANEYGKGVDETTNQPRLLRISLFKSYMKIGEKYMPSKILQVDNLNQGERTQITIENPSTAAQDDFIFTKAYLERVSN